MSLSSLDSPFVKYALRLACCNPDVPGFYSRFFNFHAFLYVFEDRHISHSHLSTISCVSFPSSPLTLHWKHRNSEPQSDSLHYLSRCLYQPDCVYALVYWSIISGSTTCTLPVFSASLFFHPVFLLCTCSPMNFRVTFVKNRHNLH